MDRGRLLAAALLVIGLSVPPGAAAAGLVFRGDPAAVAEVQAALHKFLAEQTWRSQIVTGAGGTTITAHFAAPDRFHVVLPGRPPRDGYVIGRKMWMRLGSACREVPLPASYGNPRDIMEHTGATSITVTRLGLASIDHIGAQTYRLVVGGPGGRKQEKLFIDASTGLPHRLEVPTEHGLVIVTYDEYGAPVTVNDPPC
jgi:hypothetical protein